MALETHHLSRRFGNRFAVDDASFSVERGRLTGFVGANGAGKTTVMRMILGVLAPSAGTVTFDGAELDQVTRRSFGYMPEERGLYPKMPLREQMVYFANLHGLSKAQALHNTDALLETLNLTERAKDPIENLSLGNQQRAQVAVSLVHEPTALILDEPFSGLDPMAVDVILGVLMHHAERGIPVLLSSHQLDLVERLCDDLVIISHGKILAAGSIEDLRRNHTHNRYRLVAAQNLHWLHACADIDDVVIDQVPSPLGSAGLPTSAVPRDSGLTTVTSSPSPLVGSAFASPTTATFALTGTPAIQEQTVQRILIEALSRGPVISFSPVTTPLSTIFREVVEGGTEEE